MRKILFRGKSENDGQWVEGSLVITTIEPAFDAPVKCYCIEDMTIGVFPNEFQSGLSETVDPETVGQYTGLTDKNGKKIFEGDIVEGADFTAEDGGHGVVSFVDGAFEVNGNNVTGTFHENYYGREFEVIGNIHDNPELLEVTDNA